MMTEISFSGYRFSPEIIQQAIWLYVRFTLSFRDVEDLLAECGIVVSYETVRRWVNHFGPKIAADGIVMSGRRPLIKGFFCGGAFDRGCGHVFGLSMRVLTPGWP